MVVDGRLLRAADPVMHAVLQIGPGLPVPPDHHPERVECEAGVGMVATSLPTIMREYTSVTNRTYTHPQSVRT